MDSLNVGQRFGDLEADLVIEVVTRGTGGDPVRGFRAIDALVDICTKLSGALLPAGAPSLRPLVVLEDIDSRSVIAWLRQEQADARRGSGGTSEYVNKAILESAKWLNNCPGGADFKGLLQSLNALRVSNPHLPKPDTAKLLRTLCELQEMRADLAPEDQVFFIIEGGGVLLDGFSLMPVPNLIRSAAKWHLRNDAVEMFLLVRAPDYSGGNVWSFEHDGVKMDARMHDSEWLNAFLNREIDVRAGDILRVVAVTDHYYSAEGTLLDADIKITSVRETLAPNAGASLDAQPVPSGIDASPTLLSQAWSSNVSVSYAKPEHGRRENALGTTS